MRVGLDATPLLGQPTGIGRYVGRLVVALAAATEPPQLVLVPFTWRGAGDLRTAAPAVPGVRVITRRAPARLLRAAWQRSRLPPVQLLAGPVDVFHGTNYVLPPTGRAAGVVTVHDLTYLHHPEWVSPDVARYRTLVHRALRQAGVVACTPSATVAGELVSTYRLDPDRVVVTPLGVDGAWLNASAPTPHWLSARGLPERYVLFVGNLEPRKNLPTLLSAYAALCHDRPDTPPLVLAGPPGWGPALDTAGLDRQRLILTGYLRDDTLVPLTAGASCLLFPSRYEGFGLPPLEAFGCGVPVVAGDIPVLREVLGPHARYAAPTDADAIADALGRTLDGGGPTTAAERRAHAAGYRWERCAAQTRLAYEAAIAATGSRPSSSRWLRRSG